MPEPLTTLATSKELAQHVLKWLTNLRRAGRERQQQSLLAVHKVIALARRTKAYSRGVKAGQQDFKAEAELAATWADLGFELKRLGLKALAKKCDVTSRYWADPQQFSPAFLVEADISFDSVERLARQLEVQIEHGRPPA